MGEHHQRRRRRAPIAVLLASGMLVLGAAPAVADDPQPLDDIQQQVQQTVEELLQPAQQSDTNEAPQQRTIAPNVAQDDDSPGHETPDPQAPDHAASEGLVAGIADNDVADVATTNSEIRNNHSTSADSTALALGGQEVIGSHADSDGDRHDSDGDPLAPVCEGSEGALCAVVLYSEAHATESRTTSDASARNGVAGACVGGDDPTGTTCSGPVQAGVIESWSMIHRGPSGHTDAQSGSSVADVCVAEDPLLGTCAVGVDAVQSSGSSDSRGSAQKQSNVVGLELGGQQLLDFTDPTAIAIPPNCTSPSVACVFLNQGETYLSNTAAGHAVEALHLSALDGNILAHAATSETLVHKAGARDDLPRCPGGPGCGPRGPFGPGGPGDGPPAPGDKAGPPTAPGDRLLPATGGFWGGLIAIGFLLLGAGAFLVAWTRRRELVDAPA